MINCRLKVQKYTFFLNKTDVVRNVLWFSMRNWQIILLCRKKIICDGICVTCNNTMLMLPYAWGGYFPAQISVQDSPTAGMRLIESLGGPAAHVVRVWFLLAYLLFFGAYSIW